MKPIKHFILPFFIIALLAACNKVTYRKTAGGMPYQLFPGNGTQKIYPGNIVKYNVTFKLNDSVVSSSFGKMPAYTPVNEVAQPYDISEVWTKLKVGDSVVTTQMMDTFMKRNPMNFPPQFKKGDRIITYIKIIAAFATDSIGRKDYDAEMVRYGPQMKKEQEEQMAKEKKARMEMKLKEEREYEESGEAAKERSEMEAYLKSKGINAQKNGKGTYVLVKEPGNGSSIDSGKFVSVKYTGRLLRTDSVFESSSYTFQLGHRNVIGGWDEGLKVFKQGGKGTLYIPGFMAYGKNPQPGSPFKAFDALIFDVEVKAVSDTMPAATPPPTISKTK